MCVRILSVCICVHVYVYAGALMKRIIAKPTEVCPVVELIYCQPHKLLLVARAEGLMRCHDESDPETCIVETTFEYAQVTLVCFLSYDCEFCAWLRFVRAKADLKTGVVSVRESCSKTCFLKYAFIRLSPMSCAHTHTHTHICRML